MIHIPWIWAGPESDLQQFLQRVDGDAPPSNGWLSDRRSALFAQGRLLQGDGGDELPIEELLAEEIIERYDNVGVISVHGYLVNEESPILSWFGALGYPTISRAVSRLLEDEDISSILLSISSSGGQADGISELGDSIVAADAVKPVYSWTGSSALSAAYWIGVSGRKMYSSEMARTGSIGAVATLRVVHRRLKEDGVDVYVARSAPKKAMPSPYEPLTETGKQQLQKEVDSLHGFFVKYIASRRPALLTADAERWATGETFFGEEALALGLVDSPLRSANDLISELNTAHDNQLDGDANMPRHVVLKSEEDRVRMAAGLAVEDNPANTQEPPPGTVLSATSVEGDCGAPETLQQQHQAADNGGSVPSQPVESGDEVSTSAAGGGLTAFLQERERELREETAQLRETIVKLQTDLAAAEGRNTQLELLREPMQKAVERLQVALGHRPSSMEELPPQTLAALYDSMYEELLGLPVGRQSVAADTQVDDRSPRTEEGGQVSPLVASRLSIVSNK